MEQIEIQNLSKSFKKITVLENVNLKFQKGHIYGLYGRNGSGKSVLLKLMCGFYLPTKGKILYDNEELDIQKSFPKNLGALIENPHFFPDLSGYENLKLLSEIQNKIGEEEILQALEIVNLIDEKDKEYREYSLGMKQKCGIAQAIMEYPEVILLDEPFNGIERETVIKLINYFKEIKENKIILVSTHILEDLKELTNEIFYFDTGSVTKFHE